MSMRVVRSGVVVQTFCTNSYLIWVMSWYKMGLIGLRHSHDMKCQDFSLLFLVKGTCNGWLAKKSCKRHWRQYKKGWNQGTWCRITSGILVIERRQCPNCASTSNNDSKSYKLGRNGKSTTSSTEASHFGSSTWYFVVAVIMLRDWLRYRQWLHH